MPPFRAAYRRLYSEGELRHRAERAREMMHDCVLCAHRCHADRAERPPPGACRTGMQARVANAGPHYGEEPPLAGARGSGTLFFGGCNLSCGFCQNDDISAPGAGRQVTAEELAGLMLQLQLGGVHNINLVSPSHVVAPFLEALVPAVEQGLRLPIVYNSGGYDSPEALALLDGVVDIYLPDMKFAEPEPALRFCGAPDYPKANQDAVREMRRQVGDLVVNEDGVAERGVMIRHLVLPDGLAGTDAVCRFLANEISPDTYVNIMDQYRPCNAVRDRPPLDRRPTPAEQAEALRIARSLGLHRIAGA